MIKPDYDKNERIYDLLTQDSFFILNRKLNSAIGLILSAFLVFLLDKEKYHKYNNELTKDGYFYATDMDIMLMTGLTSSQVAKLKKQAEEKEFVSIKKEGIPLKTYYKVNLQKINDILNLNKSATELSYERIIGEEQGDISTLSNISENTLLSLSFRDLRFICKKFRVKYTGTNTKQELIEKIIKEKENILSGNKNYDKIPKEINEISSIQDLKNHTFKSLRSICKKLNISYKGTEVKDVLINKIAKTKGLLSDDSNDNEVIIPDEILSDNAVINFELLFKEFDIAYTFKNQKAIEKLQKSMSDREIKDYLIETYNNIKATPGVKNIGALFSAKICKGERQVINIQSKTKSNTESVKKQEIEEFIEIKEENPFIVNTKNNSRLEKIFENLTDDEKTIYEEKAIRLCSEIEKIEPTYLYNIKRSSGEIFYRSIKKYLLQVLEKEFKEVS